MSGKDIRVILTVDNPSDELESYARKAADAYLVKPFDIGKLRDTVHELIGETSGKELVCTVLGMKFYASPKKARLLRSKVTDLVLRELGDEASVEVDIEPPVDLTPTFTQIKRGLGYPSKNLYRLT